jgi:general secretion pathway protein H
MVMQPTSATGSTLRRARGFTLIELLVVMAIMALLAATIPFAWNRLLPARRVTTTADRLLVDVRWLQAEAMNRGVTGRLLLEQKGYRLEIDHAKPITRSLPSTLTLHFMTAGGVDAVSELRVFPDGTGTPGVFTVEDSGRRAQIELSMLTGRVRRTT